MFTKNLFLILLSLTELQPSAGAVVSSTGDWERTHLIWDHDGARSCKSIQDANPGSPSGTYTLVTRSGKKVLVYCEMGLNGGGYTFLHPMTLSYINDFDVAPIFNERSTFLLRVRCTNGTQPYAVLSQLKEFSYIPLSLGINSHNSFSNIANEVFIGVPYSFFGFTPDSISAANSILGLQVNSVRATYQHCTSVYASHFALFPNFNERDPGTGFYPDGVFPTIYSNMRQNPSGRVIPSDFFMFGEIHFGGCGCYIQTNQMRNIGILSMAIGFR